MQTYGNLKEIVGRELNDTASSEEKMFLWSNVESLTQWRKTLSEMLNLAEKQLKEREEAYQSKMKSYSKAIREVMEGKVVPSDESYMQKEQGKFEEYEENHKKFVNEIENYRRKINSRFVMIDEHIALIKEQDRQALEQHLETEQQILLLCLEDQEKVHRELLLNWHEAVRRGVFLGALYMNRMTMRGSDPIEAYAKVQAFFNGPLKAWQEDPGMSMPMFEEWSRSENDSYSQEEVIV